MCFFTVNTVNTPGLGLGLENSLLFLVSISILFFCDTSNNKYIMHGKKLYTFNNHCNALETACYRNVNRCLAVMCDYPEHSTLLSSFIKQCILLNKLCGYACNCCCNADHVSSHCVAELKMKCKKLKQTCSEIKKVLPKAASKYIRCSSLPRMCSKCIM